MSHSHRFAHLLALVCLCAAAVGARAAPPQIDAARFNALIEAGDLRSAENWLRAGLEPDFEGDRIGTGLMIGAWEGNIEMMQLFARYGADVNHVNRHGEQALMLAAWKGRLEAARWLLDHGAHINRDGAQWSALHYAVFAGHEAVTRLLIERGADVQARSTNGSTPLMMAAREGRDALAQLLLAHGADPGAVNDQGEDALAWALRHGNLRIARSVASANRLAAMAHTIAQEPPPLRSQPAPQSLSDMVTELRAARAAGRPLDDILQRYEAALKAHTAAAPDQGTPTALDIRARRSTPGAESTRLRYAPR